MNAGPLALLTATLALGCSVDPSDGFSSGLTFGDGTDGRTPPDTNTDGGQTGTSATGSGGSGQGTGNNDAESGNTDGSDNTGDVTGDDSTCIPSDEICDGVDNDCDGEIDNGNPEGGAPCETGMVGICASGTTACEAGVVTCVADSAPTQELCNGLDDDCNGPIDDNEPESGLACDTGMEGVCSTGLTQCTKGVLACVPEIAATPELCDTLDNDCNGEVDDGIPGDGDDCSTGEPGICGLGTITCMGGVIECEQNQPAELSETCGNSLDDDCNGQVDEGCSTCSHDVCVTGAPLMAGCEPCVNVVCGFDTSCCSSNWDQTCVNLASMLCVGVTC